MKRTLTWTKWSGWQTYYKKDGTNYKTRNCKLVCGSIVVATLVESDIDRYGPGHRCFMYTLSAVVKGVNAFRTAREFIRRFL